ncbi:MAG: HupE/UreJ family protein, partial [Myxococcota bacterium]|nr:HupE/UreJ family protein [Myxococcota bacterium]
THHLVFGFDHVLFVLGLLLLVRGSRPLLYTITAFTVGHSVTLALSVLEIARVNSAWVEVGIALTLVATALEIVPRARRRSLFGRAPWRVAFAFGLLHGLGFAGALAEIGLPAGEIPLALFAFNVGIEVGQLAIVAVALIAASAITRLFALGETSVFAQHTRLRWVAAYGLGALSAYWLFERLGSALLA